MSLETNIIMGRDNDEATSNDSIEQSEMIPRNDIIIDEMRPCLGLVSK